VTVTPAISGFTLTKDSKSAGSTFVYDISPGLTLNSTYTITLSLPDGSTVVYTLQPATPQ
jgi:hypothetical protein